MTEGHVIRICGDCVKVTGTDQTAGLAEWLAGNSNFGMLVAWHGCGNRHKDGCLGTWYVDGGDRGWLVTVTAKCKVQSKDVSRGMKADVWGQGMWRGTVVAGQTGWYVDRCSAGKLRQGLVA